MRFLVTHGFHIYTLRTRRHRKCGNSDNQSMEKVEIRATHSHSLALMLLREAQRASPESLKEATLSRKNASGSTMIPGELIHLRESQFRGRRRSRVSSTTAAERTIWRDRLRPRTKAIEQINWRDRLRPRPSVDASHTSKLPSKPSGSINKHNRKAPREARQAPAKGLAITPITPKARTIFI